MVAYLNCFTWTPVVILELIHVQMLNFVGQTHRCRDVACIQWHRLCVSRSFLLTLATIRHALAAALSGKVAYTVPVCLEGTMYDTGVRTCLWLISKTACCAHGVKNDLAGMLLLAEHAVGN